MTPCACGWGRVCRPLNRLRRYHQACLAAKRNAARADYPTPAALARIEAVFQAARQARKAA